MKETNYNRSDTETDRSAVTATIRSIGGEPTLRVSSSKLQRTNRNVHDASMKLTAMKLKGHFEAFSCLGTCKLSVCYVCKEESFDPIPIWVTGGVIPPPPQVVSK